MKFKLVDEWRSAWKWMSVRCMMLAGALQGAWLYMPDDLRASLPAGVVSGISLGLLAMGVFGRVTTSKDAP